MPRGRPTEPPMGPAPAGRALPIARPQVLVIGFSPAGIARLPRHIVAPNAVVTRIAHPSALRRHQVTGPRAAQLVISPLEAGYFDAIDLVRRLSKGNYRGRYLALAGTEPDIDLIRGELRNHAPKLNFDVVAMDGRSALHAV